MKMTKTSKLQKIITQRFIFNLKKKL